MVRLFSAQSLAIAAATVLGGGFAALFAPIAPAAIAQPAAGVHTKGDRLPRLVTGYACSSQSWPSFDQKCLFDLRRSADDVRAVRVVSLIRHGLPASKDHVASR
jgi:hypothetical protein